MPSRLNGKKWKNLLRVGLAIPLSLSGQLVGYASADEDSPTAAGPTQSGGFAR
jgi:hypothetical protein